ncbi:hypothetical protein ABPG74_022631 [Tetrahymena malaccensis]
MNHHQNFEQFQFCSKLVWPVPSLFGIKVTEFLKHNLNEKLHEEYVKKSNINIPAELIAYIFQCSELLEVETIVHFHSIHLFHFYLERNPQELKSDLQLVCLVCLMLSSKLYEKCQICADNIIYISNYSYTKQDILKTENKILTSFNFQITLRDELLIDKVMIFLKLLEPLAASNTLEVFMKLSVQLIEALYEDFLYIKNFPDMNLLAASSNKIKLIFLLQNIYKNKSSNLMCISPIDQAHRKYANYFKIKQFDKVKSPNCLASFSLNIQKNLEKGVYERVLILNGQQTNEQTKKLIKW